MKICVFFSEESTRALNVLERPQLEIVAATFSRGYRPLRKQFYVCGFPRAESACDVSVCSSPLAVAVSVDSGSPPLEEARRNLKQPVRSCL